MTKFLWRDENTVVVRTDKENVGSIDLLTASFKPKETSKITKKTSKDIEIFMKKNKPGLSEGEFDPWLISKKMQFFANQINETDKGMDALELEMLKTSLARLIHVAQ